MKNWAEADWDEKFDKHFSRLSTAVIILVILVVLGFLALVGTGIFLAVTLL